MPLKIKVVFTTAYEHYAIRAFRYSATDYLLKPIDPDLLIEAVYKIENNFPMNKPQLQQFLTSYQETKPTTIALPSIDGYRIVEINEILWCEANANYAKIIVSNLPNPVIVSEPLKEYEQLLPTNFFRVHQSYLINLSQISQYIRADGGYVIMKNGKKIPISRRRKTVFLQRLGIKQ